ncbi:hypothetical protein NQ315_002590 [Exocentrus adspersus]|uniref:Tyr recombinase domain-containing protein n=1 Tax=Exocentrus adspersus TaxID=1586481 RepID=A0AAV8VUK4_9CUCU|nr:hypothetical protein NQ315_002590 [Exocentrus adspersus]
MAQHYPGCREVIGEGYKRRGITEEAIPTLISSLSPGTLKQYDSTPQICVARTLKFYLTSTSAVRKGNEFLFLTYKKPYHRATAQTISRWLKDVLGRSGIDTSVFKAHSVRHASTSAAFRAGANIECIRNAAGWSEKSNVFAKFYNRPLCLAENFAEKVFQK